MELKVASGEQSPHILFCVSKTRDTYTDEVISLAIIETGSHGEERLLHRPTSAEAWGAVGRTQGLLQVYNLSSHDGVDDALRYRPKGAPRHTYQHLLSS